MIRGIKNTLTIRVKDAALTSAANIEFYLRQGTLFYQYTPTVIDDECLVVIVPREDTEKMLRGRILCQLVFTDKDGNNRASRPKACEVECLLKEDGYGA